jgi:type I restriction enzyme M protein
MLAKLATRYIDTAEKDHDARSSDDWETRAIGRLRKDMETARAALAAALDRTVYFHRQAQWLLHRFPDAKLVDVPGLVKLVTQTDIEQAGWSLSPGHHVGVAPAEVDEDFPFEQTMREIHSELTELNAEASRLASSIAANLRRLAT